MNKKYYIIFILFFIFISGCSIKRITVNATSTFMSDVVDVFFEEEDIEFAEQAIPANLKLLDGLIKASNYENDDLLLKGAKLYGMYAVGFLEDSSIDKKEEKKNLKRASYFYKKGMEYGLMILKKNICCCAVRRSSFVTNFRFKDLLSDDTECARRMRKHGWKAFRLVDKFIAGTHCESPTEQQIFSRFYARGVKRRRDGFHHGQYRDMESRFERLYAKTKDPLYHVAAEALRLGIERNDYEGSHNSRFDKEIYRQWKNGTL